jgi:DNA modification methylase
MLQIKYRPVSSLVPYAKNARTHSDAQISQIAESIKNFGFNDPVAVDGESVIVEGHGRVIAAQKLGMAEVPVVELSHLTGEQKRAYILAHNKIALNSGWDENLLSLEFGDLKTAGLDLCLMGFGDREINALLKPKGAGKTDENDVPPAPAAPKSRHGDVWVMARHRVMCGDSTQREAVSALLAGVEPHLMVTDPPYGVQYDANWRNEAVRKSAGMGNVAIGAGAVGKVLNDDRADWRAAWALFPGNIAYVWHSSKHAGAVQASLVAVGFEIRCQIIWAKNTFAIGRGDYHWQHEPCWYAVKGTGSWKGDRKQTTLWQINKPQKSESGHSTQKPVECMRRPIENNSNVGQAVYDPFLGSGTTLIAAEQTGRACYGMELHPPYVDIIVSRWQAFTGKKAVRESDGMEFDNARSQADTDGPETNTGQSRPSSVIA